MKLYSLLASLLFAFPLGAMANSLPVEQIRELAIKAGFAPADASTMAAICKSESGGRPGAHNSTYPDDSYGLCQINMLDEPGYKLGEERRQRFGIGSNEDLKDPLTNLKAAKQVFDSQGFGAWSDFKNERYLKHLPAAQMQYDSSSSNQSSNLDEAKAGNEEAKTRVRLAKLSDDLTASSQGPIRIEVQPYQEEQPQADEPKAQPPTNEPKAEDKPKGEVGKDSQPVKAETKDSEKDIELLKSLFAMQMKQQQAASEAALLKSFMDRTKSSVANAIGNYQMGKSVL